MLTRRRLAATALALPFAPWLASAARAAAPPITAAIRLTESRVLIDALIDGKGPYAFVVDTGAVVSGVREELIQQLGLRKLRDVALNGGKSFPLYAVDDLVLGGAVRQQGVALFGLAGNNLGGDGLLAAGLMTTFDSELDFEAGQWRVYPTGAPDRAGFTRLASELRDEPGANGSRRIFADVALGDTTLRPILDTGMPWALTMTHGEGLKLGLWRDDTPYAPVRLGGIAGLGKSPARLVRAPRLRIGQADYAAPLVVVRPPDAFGVDSVLGLPVLRTLNLSVDRAAKAVWVKRNGLAPTESHYGGSGLWVEAEDGKVHVAEVGVGSPAAKAGVRPGDVIDGVSTVREALAVLGGPSGTQVSLKLRRPEGAATADFVLSAYL
jgi:serine protease Do